MNIFPGLNEVKICKKPIRQKPMAVVKKKTSDQIRLVGETGLVADSIKFLILSIANLPSGTLT
jgi:hypothetical protein